MDGERASLIVPGTTLLASLVAGTTYAVYRARQLAERWRPRGVSVLPVLFVVATSISYVANGGTLSQPAPHGVPGQAPPPPSPPSTTPPPPSPPVATRGVPDSALPRQGLDISYDFGSGPHPVPGPTRAAAATFAAPPKAAPPRPAPPPPPPPPPPPRRSPIPPLPPLPRPPIPPLPIPAVR
jgi:hypothetical protein